jgi:ketosteroid isomerase-like protein
MSTNAERLLASLQALERGDVDALAAQAHPDVVFVNPPYAIEPGVRHGVDGFKTGIENLLDAFEDLRVESERVIDLGDRVIGLGTWSARGRGSRYRVGPSPYAFLITLQDGLVIRYEWFNEHAEALAAAGVTAD